MSAHEARDSLIRASRDGSEHIDEILALAETSQGGEKRVAMLAHQAFGGLLALAAHGNKNAAGWLIQYLYEIVNDFNVLAWQQNQFFQQFTEGRDSILGIISPYLEKKEDNAALLQHLKVGTKHPIKLPEERPPGRRALTIHGSLSNLWASRLWQYIMGVRTSLRARSDAIDQSGQERCRWLEDALNIPDLSPQTWPQWAELAWLIIMEATANHPEAEPELYPIGKSVAEKKPKYGKNLHKQTQEANIRAKIKASLKASFEKLATGRLAGEKLA